MPKEREKDISFDKMRGAPSHAFADNVWCRLSFLFLHSSLFFYSSIFFRCTPNEWYDTPYFFHILFAYFSIVFCFAVREKEKSTF